MSKPFLKTIGVVSIAFLALLPVHGQTTTYTDASSVWENTAAWSNGVPNSSTTAVFDSSSYSGKEPTVGGADSALGIVSGDTTGITTQGTLLVTISSGHSLTLGTGGITMDANAGELEFSGSSTAPVDFSTNETIANNSASELYIVAPFDNTAASGTQTLAFTGSGTGTIVVDKNLLDNGTNGSISKTAVSVNIGNETMTFQSGATQTYSGGFTIASGTVVAQTTSAFGTSTSSGGGVALNGGTIDLDGSSSINAYATTVGGNAQILVDGTVVKDTFGTLSIGANTLKTGVASTFAPAVSGAGSTVAFGATTLTGNATFEVDNGASNSATLNLAGVVGDGGNTYGITKTGAGTLLLNAATGNTYGGGTTVSAGTLQVANTTLTASATGTGAVSVARSAALAGTGSVNTGALIGLGTTGISGLTQVWVGQAAGGDATTGNNLTLESSAGMSVANTTMNFNLASASAGNQLLIGTTATTFGAGDTLAVDFQNAINPGTFVLVAGTGSAGLGAGTGFDGSQYFGLTSSGTDASGNVILSDLTLSLTGAVSGSDSYYLILTQSSGVDDIDLVVATPEPKSWALMLGGLGVLVFIQSWKSRRCS